MGAHSQSSEHFKTGQDVVGDLARRTNSTLEEAQSVYEDELEKLESGAKVTTFVPVLAKRRAQERLLRGSGSH